MGTVKGREQRLSNRERGGSKWEENPWVTRGGGLVGWKRESKNLVVG